MKLKAPCKRSRIGSSAVNEDEYQPFLSQPTLFIPNPPPTVKLHHIASALSGYGTSIHSMFFISVKQRPRLGKFSGRSMRKRWVRVEFSSIEMAEQAYVTLHRRPIPDVRPQVLLNFRFTSCFPSVPSNVTSAPPTSSVSKRLSASQSKAVTQTRQVSRELSRKPTPENKNSSQTQRTVPSFSASSSNVTFTEGKARSLTRELTEYTKFLEALELDDHESPGQEEVDDYNSDRVLYPIDEETEEGDLEDSSFTVEDYSDAGSSIEMSSKLDSFDATRHEIDTTDTTAETDNHVSLKSDARSPQEFLKRTHSNISSVPRGVAPTYPSQIDDHEVAPKHCAASPGSWDLKDAQTNAFSESQRLIETQAATITFLRKDLHDLSKAVDSRTLIIEGLPLNK
ncbi:hypothetical protein L218DRAFT_548818 [Marasmius fiardii PR-910]|nr:hypothetical protein L218DRAFT_548818 [Marasmius fiardii PR-910]